MSALRHRNFGRERTATTKRKERERLRRAAVVESTGFEMLPCNNCLRESIPCVMAPGARKCARCVSSNSRCSNAPPTTFEWEQILREDERLRREKEEAVEKAQRASLELQEAMAKTVRLERQQSSLRTRGAEMLRRGFNTLDELEEVD